MQRADRYIASFFLTISLATPVVVIAAPAPQEDRGVYDRDHKDYHKWNDHENEYWHRYLNEQHRKDHEFTKANKKEQEDYWNWRHSHPD
jgi:hypothetical protein